MTEQTNGSGAGERVRHDRGCAAGITNRAARCQCATPAADDANEPLEGVVVDDEAGIERFCQAIIETTTEFDWRPSVEHSLPEPLREGLRAWVREFRAWDREVNR